ncbi:MAG: hypothetical protein LC620_01975 [Halobacteriales archaeon]|nr:hypothetical protein [Halobacteriales archaeon]
MSVHVACNGCRKTFEAELHMGLVRCQACQESHGLRLAGAGGNRAVVL